MRVSVLPFVDLLIMVASVLLLLGFVGKVTAMAFGVSPFIEPMDLVHSAGVVLLFAVSLIGRDWLKENEPSVAAPRRASQSLKAYEALRSGEETENGDAGEVSEAG